MDTKQMINQLTEMGKYMEVLEGQLEHYKELADTSLAIVVAADDTLHAIKGTLMDITLPPSQKLNQIADQIVSYEKCLMRLEATGKP